jgi:integral membrane sensor domain MASE1
VPSYLAKVALLAALYYLGGKLGLSLTVPPAYATVIWPPTGIALGMLLAHGRGLAPGVFLGSFVLIATSGHSLQDLPEARELLVATCLAIGATLQALLAHFLVVRWFGQPVKLRRVTEVLRLLVVAGPFTCLLSASISVATLYVLDGMPREEIADNWLTWWTGDIFGVLVFLPLALVLMGRRPALIWRDRAVRGLQAISLTLLVLPLALTFYSWKSIVETSWQQSQAQFAALATESEHALNARLAVYSSATRSGAGVFQSSTFVSGDEWRTFIEALRLRENYPGVLGLGWIERVPAGAGGSRDLVTYLEPDGVTGVLVSDPTAEAFAAAFGSLARRWFHPEVIRRHAEQFSRGRFAREMNRLIDETRRAPEGTRW